MQKSRGQTVRNEARAALAAALLFTAGFSAAQTAPSAPTPPAAAAPLAAVPGGRVFTLTGAGFYNEPSIAVNPKDPQQLAAAYQVGASVAYSNNGGEDWTIAEETAPANYRMSGDVSIAYDDQGRAFLCYIAFDRLGTNGYWGHNADRNGIFVRRSVDGGQHWEQLAHPVMVHPPLPGIPFEDKPYIVADVQPRSPHRGNLYVGWTQFTLTESLILISHSIDGGNTWSTPFRISTHAGLPRDDNGADEGFIGAVAPDGTLYVVWAEGDSIAFTSSRDGGRSFAPSRSIISIAPPYFEVAGVSRANGFPQIGWGPCPARQGVLGLPQRILRFFSPGCGHRGLLYVTWSDYRNGDLDVFSSTSQNGGRRWSPPVRVNSDPLHNGADQFFQWLAVDPATGAANIVFYDRRADPQNRKTQVVLARSLNGGAAWTNYAWTERPFLANDDFLGDYIGLAALKNHVYGVWAEEEQPASPEKTRKANAQGSASRESSSPGEVVQSGANAVADGDHLPGESPRNENQDETLAAPPRHHTLVRVGIADFTPAPPKLPAQNP